MNKIMTKKEIAMENDRVVNLLQNNLDKFNEVYPGESATSTIPKDVKMTVFCEGTSESGFAINVTYDELGFDIFIAKSWILQTEIEEILGEKIR